MLESGDSAPTITLRDHRGDTITVDPAAARYTVVYF
jgi:peroxiredoxin Q/BCP